MGSKDASKNNNVKNAICYIFFFWWVLYFLEDKKSDELKKHIKYWMSLFMSYVFLNYIITWLLMIPVWGLLWLVYFVWMSYYAYKAYKWDDIKVKYIDDLESKIIEKK